MSTQETVALQVNEQNLVRNLRYAFSNKRTVLGELMQNARRAKASKVEFTMAGNVLTVVDDGIGIADMQHLLTIGESGWDAETQEVEKAFGMGWLSCLFSAQHVTVESRGKLLKFDVNDAIGFKNLAVNDVAVASLAGTRLVLAGLDLSENAVKGTLIEFAAGFPIDVIFNGESLNRTMRLDQWEAAFTSVGHVAIRGLHFAREKAISTRPTIKMFLQGLPIYQGYRMDSQTVPDVLVHLDSKKFSGRMPDRDVLVDQDQVLKEVWATVMTLIREHLDEQRKTMSDAQWVDLYWEILEYADCRHLTNSIPFIPARLFSMVEEEQPGINDWNSDGLGTFTFERYAAALSVDSSMYVDGCFTREAFEQSKLRAVQLPSVMENTSYSMAYQLASVNRCLVAGDAIHGTHWLRAHVIILAASEVEDGDESDGSPLAFYEVTPIGDVVEGKFSSNWDASGDVKIASGFHIAFKENGNIVLEGDAVSSFVQSVQHEGESYSEITYCVILNEQGLLFHSELPHMVEDYMCEDSFDESEKEDDCNAFSRYVMSLTVSSPEETLMSLLSSNSVCWDVRDIKQLHGKEFSLSISETGELKLVQKKTKSGK